MIGNCISHFCIFKTNSIVLKKKIQKFMIVIHLCPKGQMYCIRRKNIQVVKLDQFYKGCTQITIVHCLVLLQKGWNICLFTIFTGVLVTTMKLCRPVRAFVVVELEVVVMVWWDVKLQQPIRRWDGPMKYLKI